MRVNIIPFTLINILSGLTLIPLRTFIWTTALGIIPEMFVYIYAGQNLAALASERDIVPGWVLILFVILGIIPLIPVIIKKRESHH